MFIRFTQKASLMASMRKALLVLALLVVMLQMASLPAMAAPLTDTSGAITQLPVGDNSKKVDTKPVDTNGTDTQLPTGNPADPKADPKDDPKADPKTGEPKTDPKNPGDTTKDPKKDDSYEHDSGHWGEKHSSEWYYPSYWISYPS